MEREKLLKDLESSVVRRLKGNKHFDNLTSNDIWSLLSKCERITLVRKLEKERKKYFKELRAKRKTVRA